MTLKIFRSATFEASHFLPNTPEGHKCRNMHGHSYRVTIELTGKVGASSGWILDTAEVDRAFSYMHKRLDHHLLNEIEGLENPTTELLAAWIWERLHKVWGDCSTIHKIGVTVHEGRRSAAFYDGP